MSTIFGIKEMTGEQVGDTSARTSVATDPEAQQAEFWASRKGTDEGVEDKQAWESIKKQ